VIFPTQRIRLLHCNVECRRAPSNKSLRFIITGRKHANKLGASMTERRFALPPKGYERVMLNNLVSQIRECLQHAEDCARKAAEQPRPAYLRPRRVISNPTKAECRSFPTRRYLFSRIPRRYDHIVSNPQADFQRSSSLWHKVALSTGAS